MMETRSNPNEGSIDLAGPGTRLQAGEQLTIAARLLDAPRRSLPHLWRYGIFVITGLLVLTSAATVHNFATSNNIYTILSSASFIGMVAVGMTLVVISGNFIDLSVVAQVGLAGAVFLNVAPKGIALAAFATIGSCLVFGAANALLVGVFGANAIIVTLGTEVAGLGIAESLTGGSEYSGSSSAVAHFGVAGWGPIPVIFVVFLGVAFFAYLLLDRTTIGFTFRAVGANRRAARAAGIPIPRRVALAFVVVSICAAGAGCLQAAFTNTAIVTNGTGFDFNSLAAVAIGGTSLFGGRGGVGRTVVGVLFIAALDDLLTLVGLPVATQEVVEGLVIVTAISIEIMARRRFAK